MEIGENEKTWEAVSGTPEVFFTSSFVRGKRCLFKMPPRGPGKERSTATQWPPWIAGCSSASQPRLQEASHPDSKLPVLIRGVAGQASSEKVMRMLLATVRVQATLSSRSILTAAGRSSEAKGPQLTLLFSPGEFDDSGWPALAPSPDLTGNPHFFQVTESLCLGLTSQIGTLWSLWVHPSPSGMDTLTSPRWRQDMMASILLPADQLATHPGKCLIHPSYPVS